MKSLLTIFFAALVTGSSLGVELQTIEHKVVHDQPIHLRDRTDRRYSLWTDDPAKVAPMLKEFGFDVPAPQLEKGEVFAIFFTDLIIHDLAAITFNKTTKATFADYADSGAEYKLGKPPEGKKHSHATAVIFTPVGKVGHLGVRDMVTGGLSEKR